MWDGFIVGVVPGLALSIAGLVAYQEDSDGGGSLIGNTAVIGGAALALAGGLVGVVVGNSLGKHEVVAYEQPLNAYFDDVPDR